MQSELNEIVKQKRTMDELIRAVNQYEELEMTQEHRDFLDQKKVLREAHLKKYNDRSAHI